MIVGVDLSTSAAPGSDPVAEAQAAERLGFDFVSVTDHLHGTHPTFEPWTLLTWVAAATSHIGIASRVLAVPYRNPAVLAKMAETLSRLSAGRLILGLGGGAFDAEFRAFGLGSLTPRVKIDGLSDAVQIIRGLWTRPGHSHAGLVHHTEMAEISPRPAAKIPIWLGTYGNRALDLTGRVADGWIPSFGYAGPDEVSAMRERVLAAAARAGRPATDITMAYNVAVRIGADHDYGTPAVIGEAKFVAKTLLSFVELGFDAFNLMPVGPHRSAQIERIAADVVPVLRAAV